MPHTDSATPTLTRYQANPIHVYTNKEPYRLAAGRDAPRQRIEDRFADALAMIALDAQQPTMSIFLRTFHREMKIRGYAANTISSYTAAVRSLLRWFGRPPHLLSREHVKNYLEYLYDAGRSASDISVQLVAIRNAWDKFCFRDVTLGLVTPRRIRQKIVVVSRDEIRRILQAAPSLRDTLMIGLMYGSGMRVSELARLRWRDIDLDRNQIFIWQGKGNADRQVQLPQQFRSILTRLGNKKPGDRFVFPGDASCDRRRTNPTDRHISTRTIQRVVRKVCDIAGIKKHVTPHSFRHAFATHSFEDGCDIRRIQTVLGHVCIETTTLYISAAKQRTDFQSPLDRLPAATDVDTKPSVRKRSSARHASSAPPAVGRLRIHTRPDPTVPAAQYRRTRRTQITIEITGHGRRDFLLGVTAEMPRRGFATINLPPWETWSATIKQLPPAMQQRISEASFYQTLQESITTKLMQAEPDAAATNPPPAT
jgi:site-specific recombinase XerD